VSSSSSSEAGGSGRSSSNSSSLATAWAPCNRRVPVLLAPLCDGSAGGDDTDDPWTVLEVAAGRDASGARCRGGALFLWGDNAAGRLGVAMRDGAFHEAAKGAGGGGGGGGGGGLAGGCVRAGL
jgi:hypothetical protein